MLINLIRSIICFPKKLYKQYLFNRFAIIGKNVAIHKSASISCVKSQSIIIGDNCDILCKFVTRGGHIQVGNNTTIRFNTIIGSIEQVIIGNDVIISNNVHIYDNNNHPISPKKRLEMCTSGFYSPLWDWDKSESAPVIIKDNVWIGERSTILKGVRVGEGSIIGCDSVVTKSVPPYSIVAGNPARIVKIINENSD